MTRLRSYDQLEPGQQFDHGPGRTITEHDDTMFSLMSMNQHPVHVDANYAATTQHAQRLVVGPLVIAVVIGMAERDIVSLVTLEYRDVKHVRPVFHGDTIYARSTVVAKSDGFVTVASEGMNQRGEVVVSLERLIKVMNV